MKYVCVLHWQSPIVADCQEQHPGCHKYCYFHWPSVVCWQHFQMHLLLWTSSLCWVLWYWRNVLSRILKFSQSTVCSPFNTNCRNQSRNTQNVFCSLVRQRTLGTHYRWHVTLSHILSADYRQNGRDLQSSTLSVPEQVLSSNHCSRSVDINRARSRSPSVPPPQRYVNFSFSSLSVHPEMLTFAYNDVDAV